MSEHATKVLLVEDNAMLMEMTRAAVAHFGFKENQIDEATDGKDAYLKAKQEKYVVIIMDIDMPCDGKKATAAIRKKGLNTDTIIIAHTSNVTDSTSDKELEEYKKIGFNDAIPKKPMLLIETLKKHGISPKGSK